MASLDDILTTQKNGVVAINANNNIFLQSIGTVTSVSVSATTLVFTGSGRIVNMSVITAGSAAGLVHNASSVGGITTANALCVIPTTVGVHVCNQVFTNGLVIDPGAGQVVNVTYSNG